MTTVVSMLIQQAILFARLGAYHVQVTLLSTRKLLPFARVSISASLAIIGALALFPLIGIESGMNLMESLPGAIATLVPLLAMFIVPVCEFCRNIGIPLFFNCLMGLIIILLGNLFLLIRIGIEEEMLVEEFGEEYIEYRKKTKRITPFVY